MALNPSYPLSKAHPLLHHEEGLGTMSRKVKHVPDPLWRCSVLPCSTFSKPKGYGAVLLPGERRARSHCKRGGATATVWDRRGTCGVRNGRDVFFNNVSPLPRHRPDPLPTDPWCRGAWFPTAPAVTTPPACQIRKLTSCSSCWVCLFLFLPFMLLLP